MASTPKHAILVRVEFSLQLSSFSLHWATHEHMFFPRFFWWEISSSKFSQGSSGLLLSTSFILASILWVLLYLMMSLHSFLSTTASICWIFGHNRPFSLFLSFQLAVLCVFLLCYTCALGFHVCVLRLNESDTFGNKIKHNLVVLSEFRILIEPRNWMSARAR